MAVRGAGGGGGSGTDPNAIHDNVAGEIAAITEKAAPADTDIIIIEDSADGNAKKRVQLGNILTALEAITYDIVQASQLVNEVMNFPSLESADDAQPEWWEEANANATLTEVDVAGEGITETYERALKVVVAGANSYVIVTGKLHDLIH